MSMEQGPEFGGEISSSLPVVSKGTVDSLVGQFADGNIVDGKDWGTRLTETQVALVAENPHLVTFMEMQVGKFSPELHQPMFEVIIATLVAVETQASADAMNSRFSPDQ